MTAIKTIKAIGVHDFNNWLEVKEFTYEPQAMRPYDVDIKIVACGICAADTHTAQGDWGVKYSPLCVGHEIVGHVVAAGPESRFEIGDRVGVGAQCDCCHDCTRCKDGHQNNCKKSVTTFNGIYPSGKVTQGGYASHIRVSSKFAFKIPENLDSIHVAPLLCGGITAFRPMLTANVKKGTKVGISGIGGIGHMAILFAKALGAEVTAISRNDKKREFAKELGADHYIALDEENFSEKYQDSLDLIINTASSFSGTPISGVLNLLKPYGQLIFVTAPPLSDKLELIPFQMLLNNISVGGSVVGSPKEIEYMLKVASENNIKPWVETVDISEENVSKAWERMDKGDVKFRFVLTGYDKYFE
ncbi:hypothetical protein CANINC_002453 [Pichia inconspicua]|uniref:Enoyl reductase (ER) domain-containing protein n=1 Tax=Pichia inconspicua TaxID=52247 RepID=A0A4V4NFP9_9ASCO|nr:hypothetical protein CANINC_002453 [[Candida] inconspicua]